MMYASAGTVEAWNQRMCKNTVRFTDYSNYFSTFVWQLLFIGHIYFFNNQQLGCIYVKQQWVESWERHDIVQLNFRRYHQTYTR